MRVIAAGGLALALFAAGPAAATPPKALVSVPFVGCAADGQSGLLAAPAPPAQTPGLEPSLARHLAFYASQTLGVLAPRGWSCFEVYGSGGADLIVTPEHHGLKQFDWKHKLGAAAVEVDFTLGENSGRFDVADVGARFFPSTRAFVREVRAMELVPVRPIRLSRADHIRSRSTTVVEFSTAAGKDGLGTRGLLGPSTDPVTGAIILVPADDVFNLVSVNVRLPSTDRRLTAEIVRQTKASAARQAQPAT